METAERATVAPGLDGESFDEFYRAYSERIYRALALTLGNETLAKEATDEALSRAYAGWCKVRALDNPAGWAYRVGLNWRPRGGGRYAGNGRLRRPGTNPWSPVPTPPR